MNQPCNSKQQNQYEREYEELIAECHSLIVLIAQKPYAVKVLRSTRQGLLMHLNYKSNRKNFSNRDKKGGEV